MFNETPRNREEMYFGHFFGVILLFNGIEVTQQHQSNHPNLYFSKRDINQLRQQAQTTHRDIYARLKEAADEIKETPSKFIPPRDWNRFASKWNEVYGNNFGALAMYCVLNDKDPLARKIAMQFFDAFVSLPNWRVISSMVDDVPVAHSLVAVATAYDFMYEYINETLRSKIFQKVLVTSKELYERSFNLTWGTQYIQNHVATNYVAFLTGALVVEKHIKEAIVWKERAHQMLKRTMFLLSHVVDGSMDEGVAYGSYTSRSLTQYIFLAKRHLGLDLTNNVWLREHFWFMYHTILPGFTQTVGIADSNSNWFYGPESQLVFLDSYVMRNGYGNWLASKIREIRSKKKGLKAVFGHRFCTLHTEFLFYDASIPETEPPNAHTPQLHIFKDWGVVTYGGGLLDKHGKINTFLSFKSSVLHGRAINEIVRHRAYDWITGWRNFNPGHEHPDQGSFVFAPNGVPFITEALYGPKYTWLNNALLFGPTTKPTCSASFEGQMGDCEKWINYRKEEVWLANAEIVAASKAEDLIFISGEMSGWYSSTLRLKSVYRSVTLLNPGVLLVVDHIETKEKSPIQHVGAFFHNRNSPFVVKQDKLEQTYGSIILNGETYLVLWNNSHGGHSIVQSQRISYRAEAGFRRTHFLNITTDVKHRQTRLAYAFVAPGYKVSIPQLQDKENGIHVTLKINEVVFTVSVPTAHNSTKERHAFLGFDGFAQVRVGKHCIIKFGIRNSTSTQWKSSRVICMVSFLRTDVILMFLWAVGVLVLLYLKTCFRRGFKFPRRICTAYLILGLIVMWFETIP